jgi:outer membrane protein assembly factor BamB
VIVEDGAVYAAAGIAHYDGTHVVALDAVTGKLKWRNDSSGSLSGKVNSGVSMQGDLFLEDGKLCFLGGGVYETARFDLDSGKCLNTPKEDPRSQFRTAFYPYYPEYGNYLSLDHSLPDGRSLVFDASYEGNRFTSLALLSPLSAGVPKIGKDAARWATRRGWSEKRKVIWQDKQGRRFASFIVSPELLLATGDAGEGNKTPFLVAIQVKDGTTAWSESLPAKPIKGGAAIDHQGRIFVTLENGQALCYAAP